MECNVYLWSCDLGVRCVGYVRILIDMLVALSKVSGLTIMTDSIDVSRENCKKCGESLVPLKTTYLKRLCEDCNQSFYILESNDKGQGIVPDKANQLIIPPGALVLSLDIAQVNGRFTQSGLLLFAKMFFLRGQAARPEETSLTLDTYQAYALEILQKSPLREGLDINSKEGLEEFNSRIKKNSIEWWVRELLQGINELQQKLENNDIEGAVWAMNNLTSYYSMVIFKELFEPTVWTGYMISNLKSILKTWQENKKNSCEKFWQNLFEENSIILSQVFSYPIILLQGSAYTGGKKLDNTGGRVVDFLLTNNLSQNTALVEIKTPTTNLLNTSSSSCRNGIYNVSTEITGAILQISNYKDSFVKDYYRVNVESEETFYAFNPQCMVIAGTWETEITNLTHRKTFELFRNGLKDVQLITYDELFRKIEILIDLLEGSKI